MNAGSKQRYGDPLAGCNPVAPRHVRGNTEPQRTRRIIIHLHRHLGDVAEHEHFGDGSLNGIFVLAARRPVAPVQNDARRWNKPVTS
jgi:hypothetical protein